MRQAFGKGREVEIIPLRADDKCTQRLESQAGVSYKELLAPCMFTRQPSSLGSPGTNKSGGRRRVGAPAALCPGAGLKVDGSAKSISLLVSGRRLFFLGST